MIIYVVALGSFCLGFGVAIVVAAWALKDPESFKDFKGYEGKK